MNTSRLVEIVELLLDAEKRHSIQAILTELSENLTNLANAPQEPSHQAGYSNSLKKLSLQMAEMRDEFEPAHLPLFAEIGAYKHFCSDIAGAISRTVQENPIAPTVARDYVSNLVEARTKYLERITSLLKTLNILGMRAAALEAGDAQIGFLLPRDLFGNKFEKLIEQLKQLNNILRTFSNAAVGEAPDVEVRQISTTDPLFFVATNPITIAAVAATVTWALDTWKRVEEIRKIRAEAKRLASFSADEIAEIFDSKIKATIDAEIEKKVEELSAKAHAGSGRTPDEMETHLRWAVRSLLALVEHGLKIELRFLPPTPPEGEDDEGEAPAPDTPEAAAFAELDELAEQLSFPPMEGDPVLGLSPPSPENGSVERVSKRATRKKRQADRD